MNRGLVPIFVIIAVTALAPPARAVEISAADSSLFLGIEEEINPEVRGAFPAIEKSLTAASNFFVKHVGVTLNDVGFFLWRFFVWTFFFIVDFIKDSIARF